MKFKTLPILRIYRWFLIIIFLSPIVLAILLAKQLLEEFTFDNASLFTFYSIASVIGCVTFYTGFSEKLFAEIYIHDDQIRWKCILHRDIVIHMDDCINIGLEFEKSYYPLDYPYIYFVTYTYSAEISDEYGKIKSHDGLIKFRYTKKLAEYVIKNFYDKTTFALCDYYRKTGETD